MGKVNNSELELAGDVVHSDCVDQCFVVKERTTLSRTDNTEGIWWQRKGSATCTFAPAHMLQLQSIHERFHRYVPRIDFVTKVENLISDRPSRSSDLTENQLLTYLETNFPPASAIGSGGLANRQPLSDVFRRSAEAIPEASLGGWVHSLHCSGWGEFVSR